MRDFETLTKFLARPARRLNALGLGILLIACLTGALIHANGASRVVAIAATVTLIFGGVGVLWVRFLDSRVAPAYEALLHHDLIERAAWRRATGSSMPRSRNQARRWLQRHPEPPDPSAEELLRRAPLLARTNARDEASLVLRRVRPETPTERFELLLETAALDFVEARPVDLQAVREAYLAIEEKAERRLRRICLGLLEARMELADNGDPWAPIIAARSDLDRVAPAATLRAVTARVFALVVVLAGLAAVVIAFVGR